MTVYTIIASDGSSLTDQAVSSLFEHSMVISAGHAWAVATKQPTAADVRDFIREADVGRICVIVKATEYNGYTERALWQRMEAWERL